MLIFPSINPIAIAIGPIHVHWYGLMYLLGFAAAYGLANLRVKQQNLAWTKDQISDLIFYAALGVVFGGRIGYMLFYNLHEWLLHPLNIFKIWQGGMSFHGGLIGVMIALYFFSRKIQLPFLKIADFVAPLVPLGLAAGRMGNFINAELWGRVTNVPWAMVFPYAGTQARHPSQLYEFGLEGILLFIVVWIYSSKPRATGRVSGVFLIGYALCRVLAECFRQPDISIGVLHGLTMGQWLSLPMMVGGIILYFRFGMVKDHASLS